VYVVEYAGIKQYDDWILIFMRISSFLLPFFTILAGIGGYYLRLSERLNVFDAVTGLPDRNAATTFWLIVLSCVLVAGVLIFSIRVAARHKALSGFENAFGTDPFAYPVVFAFIGVIWLIGTFLYFFGLNLNELFSISDMLFMAFSAIASVSVTLFAIFMYQDSRRNSLYALSIAPTVFICFWLVLLYKENASNPILLSYVYQSTALVATALCFYFTSGFLYGKPAPGKAVFAYYTSIYFCIVTLADGHPFGVNMIIVAIIAMNIVHSFMLLRNLQSK